MTTVYTYDPVTQAYQGAYAVPKGILGEDLYPVHYSSITPPAFNAETQQCLFQNGAWVVQDIPVPVLTLAEAQAQQTRALYAGCQAAIISGFTSSALAAGTAYPSMPMDQINQHTAAISGGQLQCAQSGVWALRQHTAAQAQQVVADFMTWLNKCQAKLAMLNAQVTAATTNAAVQAVVWTNPA